MQNLASYLRVLVLTLTLILIPSIIVETSIKGIDLIKQAEGFAPKPYICPAGKKTIGYGHTGTGVNALSITKEQAEDLLKTDLQWAERTVERNVTVALNQNQFDALVSLVYNIGTGNFEHSTLLVLLNRGRYEDAAKQFHRWVFANKKQLPGLVSRRSAEKALFLTAVQ